MHKIFIIAISLILSISCNTSNERVNSKSEETQSSIFHYEDYLDIPVVKNYISKVEMRLQQPNHIMPLENLNEQQNMAQQIAIADKSFTSNTKDSLKGRPLRCEIFNVYQAHPNEVPTGLNPQKVFKVEMYNFGYNLARTCFVDLDSKKIIRINDIQQTQPEIPAHLKTLANQIAMNHPKVMEALGYKPGETEAVMSNTRTALNKTKCERSYHLCVAPTYIKGDKALWVIVDLTDLNVVGIRWTDVGKTGPAVKISERKLKYEKIMECYCKKVNTVEKDNWKINYLITNSDGLMISDVYHNNQLILNSAKIVDWHVSYSNTDGFGYSDAVGCPEFSQAAVVATSEPVVNDLIDQGKKVGFTIEQQFMTEHWPKPCNYSYLQRFEFYTDGRFRVAGASLGRGCGNNGTYRPVFRIAFAGSKHELAEFNENNWHQWTEEKWVLQNDKTNYSTDGYQFKLSVNEKLGYYLLPNRGQFTDGSRGDFAYTYITKYHPNLDEGQSDLVSIGPCCNTDHQQGPEKFINKEPIQNSPVVIWYVPQMKNDNTPGKEYCWAESFVQHGTFKTKVYPCMAGPMFIPFSK